MGDCIPRHSGVAIHLRRWLPLRKEFFLHVVGTIYSRAWGAGRFPFFFLIRSVVHYLRLCVRTPRWLLAPLGFLGSWLNNLKLSKLTGWRSSKGEEGPIGRLQVTWLHKWQMIFEMIYVRAICFCVCVWERTEEPVLGSLEKQTMTFASEAEDKDRRRQARCFPINHTKHKSIFYFFFRGVRHICVRVGWRRQQWNFLLKWFLQLTVGSRF